MLVWAPPATGVSLVFACTKWDVLRGKADPEGLRVLAAALRWVAHSSAGHLVYTGGLQPGATGESGHWKSASQQLLAGSRTCSYSSFAVEVCTCLSCSSPILVPL